MNGVGTEKTWPAFVREGYKFDPKVLAADDTISLGCLLNRTLPMRMSHLPSLTGCPRGAGPMGHSPLHEVPYTGKWSKEIGDKLNKEGILTTNSIGPILQVSKRRGGSGSEITPLGSCPGSVLDLLDPFASVFSLCHFCKCQRGRCRSDEAERPFAGLCVWLKCAPWDARPFDIFISFLRFFFLEPRGWFLSAFILFP